MASPGEKEISWKSRLGLVAQSSGSKSKKQRQGMGYHCVLSWCHCQGRGSSGVGLMPKEAIQMDGKWNSGVARIVGEL